MALRLAQEADLDLVEVAPNSKPPVAKIMDYGKFKYEAAQKAKEARRNQANTILKEVRFRLKIDTHDYQTKLKRAEGFLQAGDKVKAMILFRGREQSRPEQGVRLLQRFAEDVAEYGTVENNPTIDGRNMVMVIGPLKNKSEAKAEAEARKVANKAPKHPAPAAAAADAAPVADEVAAPVVETSAPVAEPAPTQVEAPAPAAEAPKAAAPAAPKAAAAPTPKAAAPKAPAPSAPKTATTTAAKPKAAAPAARTKTTEAPAE
jgi:translation initiation factor IF-3